VKIFLRGLVVALSITLAIAAHARSAVPVINHENIVIVPANGKNQSLDTVKAAIIRAGTNLQWNISENGNGKLIGTLNVRSKHTIVVDIAYATDKFSITYKDSTNMKFGTEDGKPVIHPFYNKWVKHLLDSIRVETQKP